MALTTDTEAAEETGAKFEENVPQLANTKPRTLKPDVSENQIETEQRSSEEAAAKESATQPVQKKTNDHLIENKTYFVPIGQASKRRNTKILVVLVIFLIMAGIAVYAIS